MVDAENIGWSLSGLFARLAAELTTFRPELVDQFLCPLCMKLFDAVDLASGKVSIGTLSQDALKLLQVAVLNREAILISGGTGTGKTTLLNALATSIPNDERIGIIEDTAEIQIEKPDWFRFEARKEQPDLRAVTIRDLLKQTLRMRPDRILLGEVRGAEAFDLLQAMNTGHQGTLSTIHANTAIATLTRFISYIMMAGFEIPYRRLRSDIADAVKVIVHIERRNGKRYVDEILRIDGYDPMEGRYALQTIYARQPEANLCVRSR